MSNTEIKEMAVDNASFGKALRRPLSSREQKTLQDVVPRGCNGYERDAVLKAENQMYRVLTKNLWLYPGLYVTIRIVAMPLAEHAITSRSNPNTLCQFP